MFMMTEHLIWHSIKKIYRLLSFKVDDFYVLEKPESPIKYSEEEMHSKISRPISYDSYIITKKDYPEIVSYITLESKKELLSRCLKENLNGLETIKGTL